jgi:acyl carrier protein
MTEADTYSELTGIFREVFDDETLTIGPQTRAQDIADWDSQAHITLIVATEQRFGISFRTAEIEGLRNVGEFVHLIQLKRARAGR